MQKRYQLVWLTRRMQVRDHRNVNPIKHMRGYRTETKTYRLFTTDLLNKLNTHALVLDLRKIDQKFQLTNAHVVLCRHVGCVIKFPTRGVPSTRAKNVFRWPGWPVSNLSMNLNLVEPLNLNEMIEPEKWRLLTKFNLHWGSWFERGCLEMKTWTGTPGLADLIESFFSELSPGKRSTTL